MSLYCVILFWNFRQGHAMKIIDWMTISTVEHRVHCFKYYIAKSRCKIIVSLLAIKSDLSTKRDPLEFSNSMELNISEISIFEKYGIRKCGLTFETCGPKFNAALETTILKTDLICEKCVVET